MLVLAVTLHNIPEGMAVGVVFAGVLSGKSGITEMGALAFPLELQFKTFRKVPLCQCLESRR